MILLIGKILIFHLQLKIIYKELEANNEDITLNVLEIDDNEKVYCTYKSSLFDRKNKVNLLLLEKSIMYMFYLFSMMNYSSDISESNSS